MFDEEVEEILLRPELLTDLALCVDLGKFSLLLLVLPNTKLLLRHVKILTFIFLIIVLL